MASDYNRGEDILEAFFGKGRTAPTDPVERARWEMDRGERAIRERQEAQAKATRAANPKPSFHVDRSLAIPMVPVADVVAFLEYYDPTKYAQVIAGLKAKLPDAEKPGG